MASGDVQRHISSCYRISHQHLSTIIKDVCDALGHVLKDEIPTWNTITLSEVAAGFQQKWNFPNCVGAIDGKHVAIKAPDRSGSIFYNYKVSCMRCFTMRLKAYVYTYLLQGFHSIVMLAICDADYKFTYLDVGAFGSEGDAGIFNNSSFGKAVLGDTCEFPPDSFVGGTKLPFFIVGDDAFPLTKRMMKPFSKRELSREERIFNYRLSRARRCIENAFGILSGRWLCLRKGLFCSPETSQKIVKACCLLHNFLMKKSRHTYCPTSFSGSEKDGVWDNGLWEGEESEQLLGLQVFPRRGRNLDYPKYVRDALKDYVNTPEGSVPWQNNAAFLPPRRPPPP